MFNPWQFQQDLSAFVPMTGYNPYPLYYRDPRIANAEYDITHSAYQQQPCGPGMQQHAYAPNTTLDYEVRRSKDDSNASDKQDKQDKASTGNIEANAPLSNDLKERAAQLKAKLIANRLSNKRSGSTHTSADIDALIDDVKASKPTRSDMNVHDAHNTTRKTEQRPEASSLAHTEDGGGTLHISCVGSALPGTTSTTFPKTERRLGATAKRKDAAPDITLPSRQRQGNATVNTMAPDTDMDDDDLKDWLNFTGYHDVEYRKNKPSIFHAEQKLNKQHKDLEIQRVQAFRASEFVEPSRRAFSVMPPLQPLISSSAIDANRPRGMTVSNVANKHGLSSNNTSAQGGRVSKINLETRNDKERGSHRVIGQSETPSSLHNRPLSSSTRDAYASRLSSSVSRSENRPQTRTDYRDNTRSYRDRSPGPGRNRTASFSRASHARRSRSPSPHRRSSDKYMPSYHRGMTSGRNDYRGNNAMDSGRLRSLSPRGRGSRGRGRDLFKRDLFDRDYFERDLFDYRLPRSPPSGPRAITVRGRGSRGIGGGGLGRGLGRGGRGLGRGRAE